jgi:hypothetical protein
VRRAQGNSYPSILVTVNVTATNPTTVANSATVSGGGSGSNTAYDPTTINGAGTPSLTIAKIHTGNFTVGQTEAPYTINVTNGGTASTDNSTVTVTDTLPSSKLTLSSMSGTGWNCPAGPNYCNRTNNPLAQGNSYPSILVTVNVTATNPTTVTNSATVSGGGSGSKKPTSHLPGR